MLTKLGLKVDGSYQKSVTNQAESRQLANFPLKLQKITDKIDISPFNKVISFSGRNFEFKQHKNVLHYISFTGLQNPQEPPVALQMRITGVQANQSNVVESPQDKQPNAGREESDKKNSGVPGPVNFLADDAWEDGRDLQFSFKTEKGRKRAIESIVIKDREHGVLGRVPDEIYEDLKPFLKNKEYRGEFKFELSNVIAGMTKSAPTIGLRANLIYTGKDPNKRKIVQDKFDEILKKPECKEKIMLYQQITSPDEALKLILKHEEAKKAGSAREMEQAISKIVEVIDDPKNKNFLFVGHCKLDGDTSGCVLGAESAVKLKYPDKNVDCAIDDKIPGLFRDNMPGINEKLKRPVSKERIPEIENQIKQIRSKPQDEITQAEIEILQEEKQEIKNSKNKLEPKAPYDVVVMFDVPTPERFTGAFKKYLVDENGNPAKNSRGEDVKVIYIDHHPHRIQEWKDSEAKTGVDMEKIHKEGLAWIADAVPAATELVGILASKLIPDLNKIGSGETTAEKLYPDKNKQNTLKSLVSSLVIGMSTDTGSFLRTANLLPQDMLKPARQRPNFMPEGVSKWLMGLTSGLTGNINKKWLREVAYDLEDRKIPKLPLTARETMLNYSMKGKILNEDLSLGVVQVDYDQMFDVWNLARKSEILNKGKAKTTFLDVQNAFKGGNVMNILRSDPTKHQDKKPHHGMTETEKAAQEDYEGAYDQHRIAVLICQDKKAGCIDEKLDIAEQNALRLSFRSKDGTIHAELLANLFGGGGHGGASGGRVALPNVTPATPLGVEIDGKKATSPKEIFNQLNENYKIMNNESLSDEAKQEKLKKVEVVLDKNGKTCAELIKDVVVEIRKADDTTAGAEKKNVIAFKPPVGRRWKK
ncbi:MAG: hypothetical protein WCG23_09910 [bacterium]